MRWPLLVVLLLAASCGRSKAPVGPQSPEDAGQSAECDELQGKVRALYAQAATDEGLAVNLHAEFIDANVHMVMNDCQAAPKKVVPCIAGVESAADLENRCLLPLDEAGTVEGTRFGSGAR